MADVALSMRAVASAFIKANGSLQSLASKQELLSILLENEQTRLAVWLYPLDHEKRHFYGHNASKDPLDASHLSSPVSRCSF